MGNENYEDVLLKNRENGKKPSRILIVDDDFGMIETLGDIFSDIGHDTDTAENGFKAIEMAKNKSYDIALIDIKMPGIDGVETFKQLKWISPSTRVMMMTAYVVNDLIEEALKEGAYKIFLKPLDIRDLMDSIDETRAKVIPHELRI